jgi:hypothetical protein
MKKEELVSQVEIFYHNTTRRHKPEVWDFKYHCRENLKPRGIWYFWCVTEVRFVEAI